MGYWKNTMIEEWDQQAVTERGAANDFFSATYYTEERYAEAHGVPEEDLEVVMRLRWERDNDPAFFDNANEDLGYHNLKASDL